MFEEMGYMADSCTEQEAAGDHGTEYVEVDPSGRYGRVSLFLSSISSQVLPF
jgi:hypothetical protein